MRLPGGQLLGKYVDRKSAVQGLALVAFGFVCFAVGVGTGRKQQIEEYRIQAKQLIWDLTGLLEQSVLTTDGCIEVLKERLIAPPSINKESDDIEWEDDRTYGTS